MGDDLGRKFSKRTDRTGRYIRSLQDIGIAPPPMMRIPGRVEYGEVNEQYSEFLNQQRFKTARDKAGKVLKGKLGIFEERQGVDFYDEKITDEDGIARVYRMIKDLSTGKVHKIGLRDVEEGIVLDDNSSQGGTQFGMPDMRFRQLFAEKIFEDTDYMTGELKENISSRDFIESAVLNSNLGFVSEFIFGSTDEEKKRYASIKDINDGDIGSTQSVLVANQLSFSDKGISYKGIPLNLAPKDAELLANWIEKKVTWRPTSDDPTVNFFAGALHSTLTLMTDLPLYMAGGRIAGKVIGTLAGKVGIDLAANLPLRVVNQLSTAPLTMNIAGLPTTIKHTSEGGIEALLDDVMHNAVFGLWAGAFGSLGEIMGKGFSALLRKPVNLQTKQIVNFFRKNPKVVQTLSGGFTSGGLGYVTAGGTQEQRLQQALTFAALHFSSPSAWKTYAKGDTKSVMLEKDNWNEIKQKLREGKSLEEVFQETGSTTTPYYIREGNKLYEINGAMFRNEGIVEKISETPIELTPKLAKNYNYITEAIPFARKSMRQVMQDAEFNRTYRRIDKQYFQQIKNPYNPKTQEVQYQTFEYNKKLAASRLSLMITTEKLSRELKRNEIPDDYQLKEFINESVNALQMPPRVFNEFIKSNMVDYIKNPKEWAGKLKFPIEEFNKTFESLMTETEKALKRFGNAETVEEIRNLNELQEKFKNEVLIQDIIKKIKPITEYNEMMDAIKEYGADPVFEALKKLGKKTTMADIETRVEEGKKELREQRLNEQAITKMLEGKFGTEYSKDLYESLTPEERKKIAKTGAFPEEIEKALDELNTELTTGKKPSIAERSSKGETVVPTEDFGIAGQPISYNITIEGKEYKLLNDIRNNSGELIRIRAINVSTGKEVLLTPAQVEKNSKNLSADTLGDLLAERKQAIRKGGEAKLLVDEDLETRLFYSVQNPNKRFPTEGTNGVSFQRFIANFLSLSESPEIKNYVKRYTALWKLAEELGIKIRVEKRIGRATLAQFYPDNYIINLSYENLVKGNTEVSAVFQAVAHEVVHGLLFGGRRWRNQVEWYNTLEGQRILPRLKKIQEGLRAQWVKDKSSEMTGLLRGSSEIRYGLGLDGNKPKPEQYQELVTQAFTDPAFARWLNTIPAIGVKQKSGTVWGQMKEIVLSLITNRVKDKIPKTMLDEINQALDEIYLGAGKISPTGEFKPKTEGVPKLVQGEEWVFVGTSGEKAWEFLPSREEIVEEKSRGKITGYRVRGTTKRMDTLLEAAQYVEKEWQKEERSGVSKVENFSNFEQPKPQKPISEERRVESVAQTPEGSSLVLPQTEKPLKRNSTQKFAHDIEATRKRSEELRKKWGDSNKIEEVKGKEEPDFNPEEVPPRTVPESQTRKVQGEKEIKEAVSIEELQHKIETEEKEYLQSSKNYDKKKIFKPITSKWDRFLQDKILRNQKSVDVGNTLEKHLEQNLVPVYKKDFAKRFLGIYKTGEEMIRMAPYWFNTVMKNSAGWRGGEVWREFAKPDKKTGEVTTVKGKKFLNAFRLYEQGRYRKDIPNEMTWNEFADWANFTPQQRKMLDVYRSSLHQFIKVMKDMKKRYLIELDTGLLKNLSEKDKKTLGITEGVAETVALRKKAAELLVEKKYAGWERYVYYDAVRPATPDTYLLELSRPSEKYTTEAQREEGQIGNERIYTYFENKVEAERFAQDKVSEGWVMETAPFRVKDVLKHKDFVGKLSHQQLLQLALDGNIAMNDAVLAKLIEATKSGTDLHTLHKEYIPGMKYTAKEFERQLERFGREAVYGSYKAYSLTKAKNDLAAWDKELRGITKGTIETKTKGMPQKLINKAWNEFDYAKGYYNQLRASEKTVIDPLRGVTITFQIGVLKPAFLFQQLMQNLQTGLHLASAEYSKAGLGGFGEAITTLGDASARAIKAGFALRAKQQGESLRGFDVDSEFIKHLDRLEKMGKIRAVGIKELTGQAGEVDYYYDARKSAYIDRAIRWGNALGGMVEKYTRVQAASMFYEIGKRKGMEGLQLTNYIAEQIDKSMAQWGKGGRAPVFDSKSEVPNQSTLVNALKKSFLTYKTFSYYNMGLYHSLIKGKQWGALTSKMMFGAGMRGVTKFPLVASALWLAGLFSDDDIDYTMLQLADYLDEQIPGAGKSLYSGLPSLAGFDFRDTFSEDTPLLTDLLANTWSKTWEGKMMEVTLGAPFGFSKDFVKGSEEIYEDLKRRIITNEFLTDAEKRNSTKKLLKLSPVFLRNVFASMEMARDGLTLRNKKLIAREDLTPYDIVMKALSFPVYKINRAYLEEKSGLESQINEAKYLIQRGKQHYKEVRQSNLDAEQKRSEIRAVDESIREAKRKIRKLTVELNKQERKKRK